MERPFQQILVERMNDVFCVRLKHQQYDEKSLEDLGAELGRLIDENGCCKLVLNLGPEDPRCLFSVFLAKLVNLQRRLQSAGGGFALAQTSECTKTTFQAAGLEKFFRFYDNQEQALQALRSG